MICSVFLPVHTHNRKPQQQQTLLNSKNVKKNKCRSYRSLAEFFTRSLRDDVRIIHPASAIVSPCDGRVLHFGPATNQQIEQVCNNNCFSSSSIFEKNLLNNRVTRDTITYQLSLLYWQYCLVGLSLTLFKLTCSNISFLDKYCGKKLD